MKYKIKKRTPACHPAGTIIEPLSEDSSLYITEKVGDLWSYYFPRDWVENDPNNFELIENETNQT